RYATDQFPTIVSPISVGCWNKSTSSGAFIMHDWQSFAGQFQLQRTSGGGFNFFSRDSSAISRDATSPNSWPGTAWHHVVGTMKSGTFIRLYVDGGQVASTAMPTATVRDVPFYLGENSSWSGLLDECFFANLELAAASVCRICSCGLRGELCTCTGTAYASTGRNATSCNSCTLPADCTL